uniref:Uncharacterized protein n=1 Tax=Pyrodinium bahamense TaxID=73915 RepID=A0A7S0ATW1_9DINO
MDITQALTAVSTTTIPTTTSSSVLAVNGTAYTSEAPAAAGAALPPTTTMRGVGKDGGLAVMSSTSQMPHTTSDASRFVNKPAGTPGASTMTTHISTAVHSQLGSGLAHGVPWLVWFAGMVLPCCIGLALLGFVAQQSGRQQLQQSTCCALCGEGSEQDTELNEDSEAQQ